LKNPPESTAIFVKARPRLLRWFARHARALPWRPPHPLARPASGDPVGRQGQRGPDSPDRSPYAVWISEVMLQQTQVATVIPYFERWMALFPDPAALARAPEDKVLRAWAGLGYYARARNLHRAAKALAGGLGLPVGYPADAEGWKALPGIGDYTAGAVASLALGLRAPILDGNVARVFSRLVGLDFLPGDSAPARQTYWDLAARWADHAQPGAVNEGLMELGALVCVPGVPRCGQCPLAPVCTARREGRETQLPPLKKREKAEVVRAVAVRARDARGRILMESRGAGAFLAGHEMFPLFLGAGADDKRDPWRADFLKRFPGSRLRDVRAGGRVKHSIMSKRYDVEVWDCEVALPGAGREAQWASVAGIEERLTNSLAKKIWGAKGEAAKKMAAKDRKDRKEPQDE
jgi:A/G-specific adenine glycosylase